MTTIFQKSHSFWCYDFSKKTTCIWENNQTMYIIHIWEPTCLFVGIFKFQSNWLWNAHVFTLFFNKRHLNNRWQLISVVSAAVFPCMFGHYVMFNMRKTNNRKKYESRQVNCRQITCTKQKSSTITVHVTLTLTKLIQMQKHDLCST